MTMLVQMLVLALATLGIFGILCWQALEEIKERREWERHVTAAMELTEDAE